jgi:hypothetical protein
MNDLGFWMAMFTLGALAYFETPLGRLIRAGVRSLWAAVGPAAEADDDAAIDRPRRRIFIRRANGQLAGSFPSRNSVPASSASSSALECEVPEVPKVPRELDTPLTIPDMLIIAARLGQGMTPTDVAKSLPGYSGRKYGEYGDRVRHVKAILEEHGAFEIPQEN